MEQIEQQRNNIIKKIEEIKLFLLYEEATLLNPENLANLANLLEEFSKRLIGLDKLLRDFFKKILKQIKASPIIYFSSQDRLKETKKPEEREDRNIDKLPTNVIKLCQRLLHIIVNINKGIIALRNNNICIIPILRMYLEHVAVLDYLIRCYNKEHFSFEKATEQLLKGTDNSLLQKSFQGDNLLDKLPEQIKTSQLVSKLRLIKIPSTELKAQLYQWLSDKTHPALLFSRIGYRQTFDPRIGLYSEFVLNKDEKEDQNDQTLIAFLLLSLQNNLLEGLHKIFEMDLFIKTAEISGALT